MSNVFNCINRKQGGSRALKAILGHGMHKFSDMDDESLVIPFAQGSISSKHKKSSSYAAMAKNQGRWDPYKDRRLSESKIYKESHLIACNKNQRLYMVSQVWFNQWLSFLYGNQESSPGQIDNIGLANRIITEGIGALTKNVDYYPIPQSTWKSLYNLYRGGPVIILNINGKIEIIPDEQPEM